MNLTWLISKKYKIELNIKDKDLLTSGHEIKSLSIWESCPTSNRSRQKNVIAALYSRKILLARELTETYLKDMKSFKLYVAAVVSQQVHHQFQVLGSADVSGHDCKVVSVQQEFSQELCVV